MTTSDPGRSTASVARPGAVLDGLRRHVGVLVLVVVWLALAILFPTQPDRAEQLPAARGFPAGVASSP